MPYQETTTCNEVRAELRQRNAAFAARVIKAAKKRGAGVDQIEGARTLLGSTDPSRIIKSAVATNQLLSGHAFDRMVSSLSQVVRASSVSNVSYSSYNLSPANQEDAHGIVLKHFKRVITPEVKRECSNFVVTFAPRIVDDAPTMVAHVIRWSGEPEAETKRRSAPTLTADKETGFDIHDEHTAAIAAAHVWELTGLSELPHDAARDAYTCSREYECFVMRTGMLLDKVAFGYGSGSLLWRNLKREIVARAETYDLMGVAPLQAQGVAAFVSKLPQDSDGAMCFPPAIKLL